MADSFQTATMLRALLGGAGTRPKRRFGQHFLIDRNLMMMLVDAAELRSTDVVLEVGTGTGSLTGLLAERAGEVHTFEIDAAMADIAARHFEDCPNVHLHRQDALQSQTVLAADLAALLSRCAGRLKLVANLPYDVATPLLMNLLLADAPPVRMCFTIQKEVGERLTAAVGTRDYGPASILCQLYSSLERIAVLPAQAFWPPPKVESAMYRIIPRDAATRGNVRMLADVTRRAFIHRRKTIAHILVSWLKHDEAARVLAAVTINPKDRPEVLPPHMWAALAAALPGSSAG